MIPKIGRGKGFGGLLRYVFGEGKSAEIVCSNMIAIEPHDLSQEFREIASRRPNISKAVWHCSLSLSPGERLPTDGWEAVVRDFMKRVGFPLDAGFVAVRHQDKEHDHVHIIASRVNPDGTVFLGRWEAKKAIRICRELEKDYQLHQVVDQKRSLKITQGEFKKAFRTQELPVRLRAKKILEDVLGQKPATMSDFVRLAVGGGLEVIPNISKTTGKLNGFAFGLDGVSFKASQVGKQFSVGNLVKAGITYDPGRDADMLIGLTGCVVVPDVKPSAREQAKSELYKRYEFDREQQWQRFKSDKSSRLDEIDLRLARRKAAAEQNFKKSMEDAYQIKRGFFRDSYRNEMCDLYRKTLKEIYRDANEERQRLFESQKIEKLNWHRWLELQTLCGDQAARQELRKLKEKEDGTSRHSQTSDRRVSGHSQREARVEVNSRPDRDVSQVSDTITRPNQTRFGASPSKIRGGSQSKCRSGEVSSAAIVRDQAGSASLGAEHCHNDIVRAIECLRTLDKATIAKRVRRVSNEERSRSRLEAIPTALRAELCNRGAKRDVRRDDLLQVRNGKLDGQRSGGQMQMPQDHADNLLNCGGIASDSGLRRNDAVHDQPGFRVVNPMIEEAIRRAIARDPGALQEFARQGLVEIEGQAVERQSKTLTDRAEIAQAKRLRR